MDEDLGYQTHTQEFMISPPYQVAKSVEQARMRVIMERLDRASGRSQGSASSYPTKLTSEEEALASRYLQTS